MGNTIFIKDKKVYVKPVRSRLETIQKLKPSIRIKGCRSFVGMVNFVSILYLELQKLLKPIYHLTSKGKQFILGDEQQSTFQGNKKQATKTPSAAFTRQKGKIPTVLRYQQNCYW